MTEVNVVVDGFDPSDIYQGKLGNCYFLSSLSALAERGERVQRLFMSTEQNEKHCFAIALNVCGDWELVIVDDKFPTNNGRITFSH